MLNLARSRCLIIYRVLFSILATSRGSREKVVWYSVPPCDAHQLLHRLLRDSIHLRTLMRAYFTTVQTEDDLKMHDSAAGRAVDLLHLM